MSVGILASPLRPLVSFRSLRHCHLSRPLSLTISVPPYADIMTADEFEQQRGVEITKQHNIDDRYFLAILIYQMMPCAMTGATRDAFTLMISSARYMLTASNCGVRVREEQHARHI